MPLLRAQRAPEIVPMPMLSPPKPTHVRERPNLLKHLDGGGVRGAITVAFLELIEKVLGEQFSEPIHLANWFDLIGGTSTGAVIAGALALGYTTQDIRDFYLELAPKVFRRSIWRLLRLKSKFDAKAFRKEIERIVGDRKLETDVEASFGSKLDNKDQSYIVSSAWLIREGLRKDYKSSDDPW
jgi:predicted acylesterase/phospholipase RssA